MSDKTYSFDLPPQQKSIIKVIGVGGGGSNAVNHMYNQGIKDVEFFVCNTDIQALHSSPVPSKIQIGTNLTQGLGAGANPEKGRNAAIESKEEIRDVLSEDTRMLFITAGMGGGTGTGAAPEIAKVAKELGILTVGIVTQPFGFEGRKKIRLAEQGLAELRENCDTVLVILNDKLREVYSNLSLSNAFAQADNVLSTAAKSIAEIITLPGYINVDFEDVKTVMANSGAAVMGSARAEGDQRSRRAAEMALSSPLLDNVNIRGAQKILLSIKSGNKKEIQMEELDEITSFIHDECGQDAEMIFGHGMDEELEESVMVTVIATGFKGAQETDFRDEQPKPEPKPEPQEVKRVVDLESNRQVREEVVNRPLPPEDTETSEPPFRSPTPPPERPQPEPPRSPEPHRSRTDESGTRQSGTRQSETRESETGESQTGGGGAEPNRRDLHWDPEAQREEYQRRTSRSGEPRPSESRSRQGRDGSSYDEPPRSNGSGHDRPGHDRPGRDRPGHDRPDYDDSGHGPSPDQPDPSEPRREYRWENSAPSDQGPPDEPRDPSELPPDRSWDIRSADDPPRYDEGPDDDRPRASWEDESTANLDWEEEPNPSYQDPDRPVPNHRTPDYDEPSASDPEREEEQHLFQREISHKKRLLIEEAYARKMKMRGRKSISSPDSNQEQFQKENFSEPAYMRKNVHLYSTPPSNDQNVSRYSLDDESNIVGNNRFLHDNVD